MTKPYYLSWIWARTTEGLSQVEPWLHSGHANWWMVLLHISGARQWAMLVEVVCLEHAAVPALGFVADEEAFYVAVACSSS